LGSRQKDRLTEKEIGQKFGGNEDIALFDISDGTRLHSFTENNKMNI
jgi:hypothetical protein